MRDARQAFPFNMFDGTDYRLAFEEGQLFTVYLDRPETGIAVLERYTAFSAGNHSDAQHANELAHNVGDCIVNAVNSHVRLVSALLDALPLLTESTADVSVSDMHAVIAKIRSALTTAGVKLS